MSVNFRGRKMTLIHLLELAFALQIIAMMIYLPTKIKLGVITTCCILSTLSTRLLNFSGWTNLWLLTPMKMFGFSYKLLLQNIIKQSKILITFRHDNTSIIFKWIFLELTKLFLDYKTKLLRSFVLSRIDLSFWTPRLHKRYIMDIIQI